MHIDINFYTNNKKNDTHKMRIIMAKGYSSSSLYSMLLCQYIMVNEIMSDADYSVGKSRWST